MNQARKDLILAMALLAIGSSGAMAATVEVGTCSHFPQFPTIQAAVNAAPTGATVLVCPGTYPEQVLINKTLTLQGAELAMASGAVISAPAGGVAANATSLSSPNPIAAQVLVQDAKDVDIRNLTVDGSNNGVAGCTPILIGIFYENASGEISHAAVLNQALTPSLNGCQSGLGIFAQAGGGGAAKLEVEDSVVQGYQKNGITGNEAGTFLSVVGNSVTGQGPTNGAAENGIQVGFGATGRVLRNVAIDDVYAPDTINDPGDAASGILVYASRNVLVHDNRVGNTQFGIALVTDSAEGSADGNSVTWNKISSSHIFDGIEVCGNNNSIHDNAISRADESGIHLDSSCTNPSGGNTGKGNRVKENVINSSCAGILVGSLTSTAANFVFHNDFFNVPNTLLNADQCPAAVVPLASARADLSTSASQGRRQASPIRP